MKEVVIALNNADCKELSSSEFSFEVSKFCNIPNNHQKKKNDVISALNQICTKNQPELFFLANPEPHTLHVVAKLHKIAQHYTKTQILYFCSNHRKH
jgi:hypothetical protein